MEICPYTIEVINQQGDKTTYDVKDYYEALDLAKSTYSHTDCKEVTIRRPRDGFIYYSSNHDKELLKYEEYSIDDWHLAVSNGVQEQPTQSVYIDIDGTAAYWYKNAKGLTYPDQVLDPNFHYFRDLAPHQFIIDLAKKLVENGVDVCILTATDREVFADRWEWIQKSMPFIPKDNIFMCPIGADKTKFCKGNAAHSVLIDDYEKNLKEWTGQAVKSVNTVNSPSNSFPNLPSSLAEKLKEQGNFDNYYLQLDLCVKIIQDSLNRCLDKESEIDLDSDYNSYDEFAELGC